MKNSNDQSVWPEAQKKPSYPRLCPCGCGREQISAGVTRGRS